ncbi:hypothetical protein CFP71_27945 [Amycolatopsis thailandensis]|uniref:Uncharacterized protein n=1 Tax=Amycolatopsis thailandensis TaxID=589330 RepID=A0A229RUX4_9PSEU|nr:hypothetical protein CFP71_27945 [Amycolatopsis thailandensis]
MCFGLGATLLTSLAVAVVPFPCENFEAICGKQDLVGAMPMVATVVAVVCGAVGGWIALRRRRRTAPWVLAAWLLVLAGCGYSCSVLGAAPDTVAQEAKSAADREQRIAAMRARPDFETVKARFQKLHQELAETAAATVPGLRWPPSDSLLDARISLCASDTPDGRGYYGAGAASLPGDTAISETQWSALDAALREVAGRYGFTGLPGHRRTGQNDPQPSGFEWTAPDGARIEGNLTRFDRVISLSFITPCYLTQARR